MSFATATQTSLTTLKDNRNLLIKSKLPRELFVLSRVLTAFVNFLLGCIPFALVLAWYPGKCDGVLSDDSSGVTAFIGFYYWNVLSGGHMVLCFSEMQEIYIPILSLFYDFLLQCFTQLNG